MPTPYELRVERSSGASTIVGYIFEEATITVREVRSWSDDKLHVISTNAIMGPAARSMIEAEKRRREAWRAPSGPAFWISCAALVISLATLLLSAAKGLLGP